MISEFRAIGPAGGNDEFVELYNLTSSTVDIGGWKLNKSNSTGQTGTLLTFPAGTTIDSGEHYLVVNSQAPAAMKNLADITYDPGAVGHITNAGGVAIIHSGEIIDQVGMSDGSAYKEGTTLAPLPGDPDQSYERLPGQSAGGNCIDTSDNENDFDPVTPPNPENLTSPPGTCLLPDTVTTINSDLPDPSIVGQSVTVVFDVSPNGATGRVTVSDGVNSCTGTVADGECSLAFTTAGNHNLTATYEGDTNYSGSVSASETHNVNKAGTTTTITSDDPDPSSAGQAVVVQFTVTANAPGSGTPTGNVTVTDGVSSCTGSVSSGKCTISLSTIGTRTLTAAYAGDANFLGSTSTGVTHTVNAVTRTSTPASGLSVIINEIAWSGTTAFAEDEWIELYNATGRAVNLEGWRLRALDGTPNIELHGVINQGRYFLLERTDDTTVNDVEADQFYTGELADSGERLYLYNASNLIVDYANTWSSAWLAGSVTGRRSMERRGVVADSRTTWVTNMGIVRNGHDVSGNAINGTPKRQNWAYTVTLTPTPKPTIIATRTLPPQPRPVLNEFLPRAGFDWNQDGKVDVFDEFIEVANHGPVDWNTSGWKIDDEDGGAAPFPLPQMTLKPGDRAVFYGLQTNLLLSDGGETVRLINTANKVFDAQTYPVVKNADQSWCRLPDINGSWFGDCFPTPNFPNARQGNLPSLPPRTGLEELRCTLADTLPEEFILAECRAFGANMWSSSYWDLPGWRRDYHVRQNGSKWETFVE